LPRLRELQASLEQSEDDRLQTSLSLFQVFMDNAPLLAWMKEYSDDPEAYGTYVYMSRPFTERFNLSWADAYGQTDLDLWGPQLADQFRRNDRYVLQTGEVLETVENGIWDGRDYVWLIVKFPFLGNSPSRYVGGIGLELPDLTRLQERIQQNLYRLAHLD
jgi:hypothetical protein